MESTTDEPTQSKLHRSEGGYRQAAPMQNLQAAPSQMHLSERRVMNHSEQIEAHVRMEAAQDLHRDLQAMTRTARWGLYSAKARELVARELSFADALEELKAYDREIFPEDHGIFPEDFDFEPHRYYGEGRNE